MSEESFKEKKSNTEAEPVSPLEVDNVEASSSQSLLRGTTSDDKAYHLKKDAESREHSRPQSHVRFEEEKDAPTKPPRPMSPRQQAEITLIEAFPTIDTKVVKAVLAASGGQVEPAFNALLGMSDPEFQADAEPTPPPKPPRPTAAQRQMELDEAYARQLAGEQYQRSDRRNQSGATQPHQQHQQQGAGRTGNEKEYSFFDDELPEIRENLRQGFVQTQSKVNKWISDFRKRIDGDDDYDAPVAGQGTGGQRQNFGSSQSEQVRGILRNADASRERRSTDRARYDADPQVLSGDFSELVLRDADETPPKKPARPLANPNLFKPTPPPPQSGPVDEVDALYHPSTAPMGSNLAGGNNAASSSPARQGSPSTPGSDVKSKKWQPLTSIAPAPEADGDLDGDNDPFLLGDSDEEDKTKDIYEEATERLKRASISEGKGKGQALEPQERSGGLGTRDKTAEDLLNG